MLSNLRDSGEPLSIKITEGKLKTFYYAVFYGDGNVEGCLCAAAGGYTTMAAAWEDALADYRRQIKIRSCEHDWEPMYGKRACIECGVFDWSFNG